MPVNLSNILKCKIPSLKLIYLPYFNSLTINNQGMHLKPVRADL